MTKIKFLLSLHDRLSGLPRDEVEERLNFYSEMIEDRMEEGLSEEEAVAAIGSVGEIVTQITADIPLAKIAKEKIKPKRRLKVWEILFLVLGSPLWFTLLIAVLAVILSIYISLWAVVISFWAIFVSFIACAFAGIVSGIGVAGIGYVLTGVALLGAGSVCAGISIFLFFGCRAATKTTILLAGKAALGIKNCFVKKEEAK